MLDKILNDQEKIQLQKLADNEKAMEALKKVLLAGIYSNGVMEKGKSHDPKVNFALAMAFQPGVSPEQLGIDLKVAAEGIRTVENAFNEIGKFKTKVEVVKKDKNPR